MRNGKSFENPQQGIVQKIRHQSNINQTEQSYG